MHTTIQSALRKVRNSLQRVRIPNPFSKQSRERASWAPRGLDRLRGTVPTFVSRVRLSVNEQMIFAKRLSFLVGAGVPLMEGLYILKDQARSGRITRLYESIIKDVSNGQFLSTGLAKHSTTFGVFAINIIRVGELSGTLSQNLAYLAEELRKRYLLRKKVIASLVYPIVVTIATLGVTGLLTVYIFPKVMPIFVSLNVNLPITTRVLLGISVFLQSYGLWLIGGIILFIIGVSILRTRVYGFRFATDRIILLLPITGRIALYYNMANFCRTLGIQLKSGFTLSEALAVTGETLENRVYRNLCKNLASDILSGKRLSIALEKFPRHFPHMTTHMVRIGEQTGNLSETLIYLSDMYEAEVDDLTKNLSSAIEPLLMVIMGLVVGFVAVSVITPIYEVTQNLQR